MSDKPSFDFIRKKIDEELHKKTKDEYGIVDKIKMAHDIKNKPPYPGAYRVSFARKKNEEDVEGIEVITSHVDKEGEIVDEKKEWTNGLFALDLNIDANWWFSHTCTTFPLIIDQAKRATWDIKRSVLPFEKRREDFKLMFLLLGALGFFAFYILARMMGWI